MNLHVPSVVKAGGGAALIGFILGILSGVPLLRIVFIPLLCLGIFLLPIVAGVGYGYLAPGKEELQESALGGALAGLVGALIYSLATGLVSALSRAGALAFLAERNIIPGASVGIVGVLLLSCLSIIIGLIFGAIGGVLWPVFQGNRV